MDRVNAALLLLIMPFSCAALPDGGDASIFACSKTGKMGSELVFKVTGEKRDRWNPLKNPNPPLSAGKALAIATEAINTISPLDGKSNWRVQDIRLFNLGGAAWFYNISFSMEPANLGPSSSCSIIVRFDGSVPNLVAWNNGE
ncbi:hypothetical protein [Nevskia ramosa]|uniref:hypothetical protein n=1 Tax=Nevskia ramosa TaxID=64002 RepID=UPI003D10AACB